MSLVVLKEVASLLGEVKVVPLRPKSGRTSRSKMIEFAISASRTVVWLRDILSSRTSRMSSISSCASVVSRRVQVRPGHLVCQVRLSSRHETS